MIITHLQGLGQPRSFRRPFAYPHLWRTVRPFLLLGALVGCSTTASSGVDPPNEDSTLPAASDAPATQDSPPSPRGGAPAVWIAGQRRMLLFGGMLPITDDTWIYDTDLDRWQRLSPQRQGLLPAPRCHHTLVSDSGTERILMFGGFSHAGRFNDVWRFDPITEQWIELVPSGPAPAPRCLHAAAYDPIRDEMLVYGGISGAGISEQDFFDDTHVLNVADGEWARVDTTGPGKRSGAVAFYSTTEDAVFLWGGKRVSEFPNDLWRFDPDERRWGMVQTTGDLPLGREDPAWFWDEANQRFLMYSGRNESRGQPLLGDAFELDLSTHTWRRLDIGDAPAPRWRSSVVFDGEIGNGIMFGGWRDFGGNSFNDTWSFDSMTLRWTLLSPEAR